MITTELWKDIPGYEGYYQVSNLGKVKGLKRGLLLLQTENQNYMKVTLSINRNRKYWSVHRLVMLAFVGKSDLLVDHINGIKWDNRLENLRYVTHRENSFYYRKNQKLKTTSKYVGVSFDKSTNKWVSLIQEKGKNYNLGSFFSEEDAHKAYLIALEDIKNNREITRSIKQKSSPFTGISYVKKAKRWTASIWKNGKLYTLGNFHTESEALEYRNQALEHYNNTFEFPIKQRNETSKYKGVSYDKSKNKWVSYFKDGNKQVLVGTSKTEIEAYNKLINNERYKELKIQEITQYKT